MAERLQKVMSEFGVASRRKCEELIAGGRVRVNGRVITEQGCKVEKDRDIIEVDGKVIRSTGTFIYILMNKPAGYITSVRDQFGRPTVLDLLKGVSTRVFPIGRLDYDTKGLLILTNDGDLTYRITHPRHNIDKTYRALVKGKVGNDEISAFRRGMAIEDYVTSPAEMKVVGEVKGNSIVEITIHEGKNRQVRKMCAAVGHEVIKLTRIRIGELGLGKLGTGQWRYLEEEEINYLKGLGEK